MEQGLNLYLAGCASVWGDPYDPKDFVEEFDVWQSYWDASLTPQEAVAAYCHANSDHNTPDCREDHYFEYVESGVR